MSLPYTPGPAVSFPARRSPMRPAQDARVATVRDISSAPSVRRRIEAQRADDPAFLRAPVPPRRPARSSRRSLVAGALATLALSVGAGALGLAIQPSAYDGPTVIRRPSAVIRFGRWPSRSGANARLKKSSRILNASMASAELCGPVSASSCPFGEVARGTPVTAGAWSVYR